jgi:tetratricopeptide (TPR) repeat protein
MFDDEDDDFQEQNLNEDLQQFELHLKGQSSVFLDSDRIEGILDHFLINGNYQKAKQAAEYGMERFGYNQLFILRKAQSLSGLGQLNEAMDLVNQLEKIGDNQLEVTLTKAALFSQLRDSKNAIKYFKSALILCEPEDKDEIYLDIAMEYQNLGQTREAIDVLKEAITTNPQNEGALYEIAFLYDQLGDYKNAIKCYTDFIDENPYSYTAWYNLGNAHSKLEDFDKAVIAYDYAILINVDFGPAHFNMANAYLSQEKFHKAIEHFHECIKLDGEDAMALCYLGEAHEQLNELELARHYYKRSLELTPMLSEAWLGLGIITDIEGNTREGITLIQKALHYDQENAGIYHVLAGAYEKLNEIDLAKANYITSLDLDPNDEECLSDYVDLLMEESPLEALKVLQEFMVDNIDNRIAKVLEVNLKWMLGQKSQAIELFAKCLQENSTKAKTIFEINPKLLDDQDFLNLSAE